MIDEHYDPEEHYEQSSVDTLPSGYWQLTKTGTYSYLICLPLIVIYEVGVRLINSGAEYHGLVADDAIKHILAAIGLGGTLWISLVLSVVGAGILIWERKKMIPIIARYFLLMVAEGAIYAVFIGFLIGQIVQELFTKLWPHMQAGSGASTKVQDLVLSLGAGIYEEILFRLIIVGLLYLVMRTIMQHGKLPFVIAAIIGAMIFSGAHYISEPFTLPSFTFRFLMGLAFNVILLKRGFGMAALTHALYDVYVTLFWS